ncbi:bifunctional WD repeat-containing protein WDR44-Dgr2/WD40 repeat/WD40-YVTN repeat-like-containing domain superfamily/WD40-repeat-containing domain superfamily [Babesia duncani]|uniref:Bifunctional WD repeat-containing protein WDR44-Dgr2/WD40 repeat/WD40-YVTN repeat-like-containing domain superfamily/WD40-repeat-containing domain superfamily n=1 Tax=Babesia duncani TaxID=323732 RepID=A0AAD9PK24_9APIC|nr:bifunctional WD repeat-containing protein WDR44-Dgr2/WD40 repeat/WD40-YVTN repeat-like-containing domain superfamily/WD40-repeat-containing domain superfamily [Babesia duncani]
MEVNIKTEAWEKHSKNYSKVEVATSNKKHISDTGSLKPIDELSGLFNALERKIATETALESDTTYTPKDNERWIIDKCNSEESILDLHIKEDILTFDVPITQLPIQEKEIVDPCNSQRKSAFFNKIGSAGEHYLRAFGSNILSVIDIMKSDLNVSIKKVNSDEINEDLPTKEKLLAMEPIMFNSMDGEDNNNKNTDEEVNGTKTLMHSINSQSIERCEMNSAYNQGSFISIHDGTSDSFMDSDSFSISQKITQDELLSKHDDKTLLNTDNALNDDSGLKTTEISHTVNDTVIPNLKLEKLLPQSKEQSAESTSSGEVGLIKKNKDVQSTKGKVGDLGNYVQINDDKEHPREIVTVEKFADETGIGTSTKKNEPATTSPLNEFDKIPNNDAAVNDSEKKTPADESRGNTNAKKTSDGNFKTISANLKPLKPFRPDSLVTAMHISNDNKFLATGNENGELYVWKFESAKMMSSPEISDNRINALPKMLNWEMLSSTPTAGVQAHEFFIYSIHISKIQNRKHSGSVLVVTSGGNNYVRIWALTKSDKENVLILKGDRQFDDDILTAFQLPISQHIAICGIDQVIEIWKFPPITTSVNDNPKNISSWNKTKERIDVELTIQSVSYSPSGMYIAIGSIDGLLSLYSAETMKLISMAICRNEKGWYSNSASITGIVWNTKETLVCATTADSRIRLFSTNIENDNALIYAEKLKGHKYCGENVAARFTGLNDEYVICISKGGYIVIWKHSCTEERIFYDGNPIIKNTNYCKFKIIPKPYIGKLLGVFNPGTWGHLWPTYQEQSVYEPLNDKNSVGCLDRFLTKNTPGVKFSKANPKNAILLVASVDGSQLLCTIIDASLLVFKKS